MKWNFVKLIYSPCGLIEYYSLLIFKIPGLNEKDEVSIVYNGYTTEVRFSYISSYICRAGWISWIEIDKLQDVFFEYALFQEEEIEVLSGGQICYRNVIEMLLYFLKLQHQINLLELLRKQKRHKNPQGTHKTQSVLILFSNIMDRWKEEHWIGLDRKGNQHTGY